MGTYRRGIASLLLAIIMVVVLTSSIGIMFRRITISQKINQQTSVAQQAFQAAYSGIENWQYQLRTANTNAEGKEDIPLKSAGAWQCTDGSSVVDQVSNCGENTAYRVVCQSCGPISDNVADDAGRFPEDGDRDNDELISVGQKIYQGNIVTRAVKIDFSDD